MQILIPRPYATRIYIAGLALLVIGLPLSKFLMSVSQLALAVYWVFGEDSGTIRSAKDNSFRLLARNIGNRFRKFFRNPSALVLASVFLMHVIGLLWTSDYQYGLEDVRKKIPLFVIPLVIATSEKLDRKQFDLLMGLFVSAVLIGTFVSMAVLAGIIPPRDTSHTKELIDIRDISIFISHIRFSLLIVLSVFITGFYAWHKHGWKKLLCIAVMIWLIIFLVLLESVTGLLILLLIGLVLAIYHALTQRKWLHKIVYLAVIAVALSGIYSYVNSIVKQHHRVAEEIDLRKLDTHTKGGYIYYHDTIHPATENGYRVWLYVSWEEMEREWNKRSEIKFMDKDLKGNDLRYTLLRFLTSKGERKDAESVKALTVQEVHSVERGIANVNEQGKTNLSARIHEIVWEVDQYSKGGNPSGHSVSQRMEFWKAAVGIISNNRLIGVGTGDVKKAFEIEYDKMSSPLSQEWRLRSHNQYLAITVAFGFIGLAWFLVSLVFPMIKERRVANYFYIVFFMIAVLSMVTEDTLETQAGVTFFAFFNAFFLFSRGKYEGEKLEDEMLGI
jgi:O-antigen ligase